MKLGQFINGIGSALQGLVVISVWEDGEEVDRIEMETDGGLRGRKDEMKGLLSLPINYMFANQVGQLTIEIEKGE